MTIENLVFPTRFSIEKKVHRNLPSIAIKDCDMLQNRYFPQVIEIAVITRPEYGPPFPFFTPSKLTFEGARDGTGLEISLEHDEQTNHRETDKQGRTEEQVPTGLSKTAGTHEDVKHEHQRKFPLVG